MSLAWTSGRNEAISIPDGVSRAVVKMSVESLVSTTKQAAVSGSLQEFIEALNRF